MGLLDALRLCHANGASVISMCGGGVGAGGRRGLTTYRRQALCSQTAVFTKERRGAN